MKRVFTNWCLGTTSSLMSKATSWKSRQRYLPNIVYSVSVLILKNKLIWRNVLHFMDGLRKYEGNQQSNFSTRLTAIKPFIV